MKVYGRRLVLYPSRYFSLTYWRSIGQAGREMSEAIRRGEPRQEVILRANDRHEARMREKGK